MGAEQVAPSAPTTVLQIWLGDSPPAGRLNAMRQTLELCLLRGWRYVLVGNTNVMLACPQVEFLPLDTLMDDAPLLANHIERVDCEERFLNVFLSDLIRVWYAGHKAPLLYVDCDCAVRADLPEFKPGTIAMARYGLVGIDYFLFWSDDVAAWQEIYGALIERIARDGKLCPNYFDLHILVNRMLLKRKNVCVIEEKYFRHKVAD